MLTPAMVSTSMGTTLTAARKGLPGRDCCFLAVLVMDSDLHASSIHRRRDQPVRITVAIMCGSASRI